ncbi:MAG: hypothetical protein HOP29_12755 [Phycisphaerales bacterium]|nr:hypothetical protein [Phycisphaerales bacterium]
MGLTITNTNTLSLLNIINRSTAKQAAALTQLSTGKKINRGSDNPAGLIALENLNAQLNSVNVGIENNQRTDSQLAVADAALEEVSTLLGEVQTLTAASANEGGLSAAEVAANQSQIDQAIDSIDRIIRTTSFNGKRLLDGTLGINTSGIDSTKVTNLRVFSRPQGTAAITVTATITASAQTASAGIIATAFNAAGTNYNTSGTTQLSITGTLGNAVIELGSGLTRSSIISAINNATSQTGISAINNARNEIQFDTTGFGTDEFISVDVLSGGVIKNNLGANTLSIVETSRTEGVDAAVSVNGQSATVDGLDVYFTANGLSLQYSLSEDYGYGRTASRSNTETFSVEATGGATFQLGTDTTSLRTIGINSLLSVKLGGGDAGAFLTDLRGGQSADLNSDVATALKTVNKAIQDVATERGRIGAFQKFQVQSATRSLEANKIGLTTASSIIGDTDFAVATTELNKQSVLVNSGISLLGLANQQASQLLSLLG